jgi:DNA (cytosine-5)-methyltransferase 1
VNAVDLFAGAGGFTEGAEMAGCRVLWAANHWPVAVETHAANHPETVHACQDLHQTNWATVPRHDLLLASWCCQGNTHVRGFLNWALYPAWRMAVEALGYCMDIQLVDAADHGVPQHRERLFFIGVRAKHPLLLRLPKRDHMPASSFIDFDAGVWSPIERPGRATATLARVANGRRQFGDRFVMPYYGTGSGLTGRSLARPIGTITTRDRWAVVDGDRMRMLSKEETRAAIGFRPDYILPGDHRLAVHVLGNAVALQVACDVIEALREAA